MELPVNQFKRGMKAGKPQIGLWSSLSSHYSVEVIAGSGFDWLLLDTEHSPNDLENVLTQLQAASAYPTTAIVRPAWNDMVLIKRFLDVGVQTLLIPYVQTPEEAADAVAYTRYPLRGVRGVAGTTRATRFGRIKDYYKRNCACCCRWRRAWGWTTWTRSATPKASTGCSSARPTCPQGWVTWATSRTRKCGKR